VVQSDRLNKENEGSRRFKVEEDGEKYSHGSLEIAAKFAKG